jgi:hypothetical protein
MAASGRPLVMRARDPYMKQVRQPRRGQSRGRKQAELRQCPSVE